MNSGLAVSVGREWGDNIGGRGEVCAGGVLTFCYCFFFFQAEDGIRDWSVTGVQTCALPI